MNYPIFSLIVNQIENRFSERGINVEQFRVWNENKINATGLEIVMNLSTRSDHIRKMAVNLDWDKFREAGLAKQLPGMEKHPLLNDEAFSGKKLSPYIDVETVWHFNEEKLYSKLDSTVGNRRIEAASHWMEHINRELKKVLSEDNLITRWHVEIEGDLNGRFVTDMSLISYRQIHLEDFKSLNEVHRHVAQNLQNILLRTDEVLKIASRTLELAA
ncbi:hypothetical protein QA596_03625 [Balneolales bacterium ANBcel1]|nr:hypothetical protein [Balneolales bacterium ANBcel1]